ncbi:MAG: hypothetical protein KAT65_01750 [Methanophagales archaeon]|nr:hypothetical protein [Methanophagales archaeon]
MMMFTPLFKNLGLLFLLVLIPVLLLVRLWWDAILPMIIYFQLLLLWAQAEIGLRQHVLLTAQFEPYFDVKLVSPTNLGDEFVFDLSHPSDRSGVRLRNTSKNPAYNIMIGRILNEQNRPIPPDEWKDKVHSDLISSLAPDQEVSLCSLDEDIIKNKLHIEVSYSDQFGELRAIYINFLEDRRILLIPERRQPPGILLNLFEYFSIFFKWQLYKLHR